MSIVVRDKYFWFVFLELICGFIVSIAWMSHRSENILSSWFKRLYEKLFDRSKNHDAFRVVHGVMLSGAFFPTVFRSLTYTHGKEMGTAPFLTLMILALSMYIVGGVVWLVDNGNPIRGTFAIIAGVILLIDMILKLSEN